MKRDLINFLREEQKQLNVCFYCNDFEFADRLLKFLKALPHEEISSVSTNKQAKEVCGFCNSDKIYDVFFDLWCCPVCDNVKQTD